MTSTKRIFIVGHSGAGKGILAQALADKLGWQYVDADFALAPSIGRPASEIIGEQGVAYLAKCLSGILAHHSTKDNIVVTTDDSIVSDEKARALLAKEFTVYLKVSTPVQLDRISQNRPLLPTIDYKSFLDKLHHERDALYEQVASLTINSDDNDLEGHTNKVLQAIK